jgi:hypothetical protein
MNDYDYINDISHISTVRWYIFVEYVKSAFIREFLYLIVSKMLIL